MAKVEEKVVKMLARIKATADGKDLIEYIKELDRANYTAFKRCPPEGDAVHKGIAKAYDHLIKIFEEATFQEKLDPADDGNIHH